MILGPNRFLGAQAVSPLESPRRSCLGLTNHNLPRKAVSSLTSRIHTSSSSRVIRSNSNESGNGGSGSEAGPTTGRPSLQLTSHQKRKLREAAAAGRRSVAVNTLSKELGLERQVVLTCLKHPELLSGAASSAAGARKTHAVPPNAASSNAASSSPATFQHQPSSQPSNSRPVPQHNQSASSPGLWNGGFKGKRLGWDIEATCERVYQQSRYPSKQLLRSIHDLHSVPHVRILDWFAQRRRQGGKAPFDD